MTCHVAQYQWYREGGNAKNEEDRKARKKMPEKPSDRKRQRKSTKKIQHFQTAKFR